MLSGVAVRRPLPASAKSWGAGHRAPTAAPDIVAVVFGQMSVSNVPPDQVDPDHPAPIERTLPSTGGIHGPSFHDRHRLKALKT